MSPSRGYASPVRLEQVEATRRRIVHAADELIRRDGYSATSVASIARQAGVSGQTVYNVFGSKAAVLKAAYDVAIGGDDEQVALADDLVEARGAHAHRERRCRPPGHASMLGAAAHTGPPVAPSAASRGAPRPEAVA